MCGRVGAITARNTDYIRDQHRGRIYTDRFARLRRYVQRRWYKSRDLRHASRWVAIAEEINRRDPLRWQRDSRGLW